MKAAPCRLVAFSQRFIGLVWLTDAVMDRIADRVMLLSARARAFTAFAAGAIAVLALPPFDFFAVMFVSFPVLVWLIDGAGGNPDHGPIRRLWPAFVTGWWFGFGYFFAGLWWLGQALLVDAENFAWALPLAMAGLPALLALFYGFAVALARAMWSDGLWRIVALAATMALAEWLRATLFTGFPWNALGYTAMPVPLAMQSVKLVGLYGMTAFAVFVYSAPGLIAGERGTRAGTVIALLLVAAHLGYGAHQLNRAENAGERAIPSAQGELPPRSVFRIVQPSIAQSLKWDVEEGQRIFERYLELSALPSQPDMAAPSLIIWPETAIPFILTENPAGLVRIAEMLAPGQMLVTGAVRKETVEGAETRYYNSILVIDDEGEIIAAADKLHLVPFGEYLPFETWLRRLGLSAVADNVGGFSSASHRALLPLGTAGEALPLICYEAIFPDLRIRDGHAPDFLLNLTNDGWFGRTPGPYQHLRQAQLRAVETGLPLIRAANSGVSVVTDEWGRIRTGLALGAIGVMDFYF